MLVGSTDASTCCERAIPSSLLGDMDFSTGDFIWTCSVSCPLNLKISFSQDSYQCYLLRSLELALCSPQLPPDILQTLLQLAEFMDRSNMPLPMENRMLAGLAEKCHTYAKALR